MSYIKNQPFEINSFLGLNRSESAMPNEMYDMQNLTSDKYPYLSPKKADTEVTFYLKNGDAVSGNVRAVITPSEGITGFCGIIGTDFYYNGEKKPMKVPAVYENGVFQYGMEIASDGKLQLIQSNRIIIIHGWDCKERTPYIYYYNTNDYGKSDDNVKSYEYKKPSYYTAHTMNVSAGGSAKIICTVNSLGKITDGYFDFKEGDSVFIDGYMRYVDSRWEEPTKNQVTSAYVTSYTESVQSYSNGMTVWKCELSLRLCNNKGENPISNDGTYTVRHIYKKIPYMTHLTLHKGRLWGANPNGEYVYASALGEIFDFSRFDGLNDDSIFLESSTGGGYLGVISCGDALAVFKKKDMEVIYGELPSEFAVGRYYAGCGCCDISSCVVIDDILYYLNDRGVYAWNGSRPVKISERLNKKYKGGFGFTDGEKYFISATDDNGAEETLCYTPKYGLWHRIDETPVSGAFELGERMYIVKNDLIYIMESGEKTVRWNAQSAKCFSDEYYLESISGLWIFAKMGKKSEIKVYTSVDDGEWEYCGEIRGTEKTEIYRIPVRMRDGYYWRYRLEGVGDFIIYGIKADIKDGGQIYSNERIRE